LFFSFFSSPLSFSRKYPQNLTPPPLQGTPEHLSLEFQSSSMPVSNCFHPADSLHQKARESILPQFPSPCRQGLLRALARFVNILDDPRMNHDPLPAPFLMGTVFREPLWLFLPPSAGCFDDDHDPISVGSTTDKFLPSLQISTILAQRVIKMDMFRHTSYLLLDSFEDHPTFANARAFLKIRIYSFQGLFNLDRAWLMFSPCFPSNLPPLFSLRFFLIFVKIFFGSIFHRVGDYVFMKLFSDPPLSTTAP